MPYSKDQSQAEFKQWSASYDDSILQGLLFGRSHNCILNQIRDQNPARLLDIGCGTGLFAQKASEVYPTAEVLALDSSREMIERGRQHAHPEMNANIQFVLGDSESIPLACNSFDVVTCANSFHHYPNQVAALKEMHRVLRPDGQLLIIDGYRDRLWGRLVYDVCVVAVEGPVHHASARAFRELFLGAGFVGIRQQAKLGLAPFLLTVGTAAKTSDAANDRTQRLAA